MSDVITVVVPVYNAEKYLRRCLDSIIHQTKKELEILLIDDGSTDSSGAICDSYAVDPRVRVFHKENSGVGAARNLGIQQASGKYIAFVDSDDVCDLDLLRVLYESLSVDPQDALSICGMTLFQDYPKAVKVLGYATGTLSIEGYVNSILLETKTSQICGAPYCKLFQTDILRQNGVLYPTDTTYAEDFIFNMRYLHYVDKVHVIQDALYYYQMNTENSLTQKNYHNFEWKRFWNQRQTAYQAFEDVFFEYGQLEKNRGSVNLLLNEFMISTIMLTCKYIQKKEACIPIIETICKMQYCKERLYHGNEMSVPNRIRIWLIKREWAATLYYIETVRYKVGRMLHKV